MAQRTQAKWDSLTPAYRARLERFGITRRDYLSGAPLGRARGKPATGEWRQRRERETLKALGTPYKRPRKPAAGKGNKFTLREKAESLAPVGRDGVRADISGIPDMDLQAYIDFRQQMNALTDQGNYIARQELYRQMLATYPDWPVEALWYHTL